METSAQENPQLNQEKELFAWMAPARPFKKRNRDYYVTLVAMASIVGLVLFLAEGFMPLILLMSIIFLFYVMNTVEPENIEYKITNWGIKIAGKLTTYDQMIKYWFDKRMDNHLLIVKTVKFPNRLEYVINETDKDKIKEVLKDYVYENEESQAPVEKLLAFVNKKFLNG